MKVTLFTLIVLVLSSCNFRQFGQDSLISDSSDQSESEVLTEVKVSDLHFSSFTIFSKKRYSGDELKPLFQSIVSKGDEYCEMIHRRKPYNAEIAAEYVRKEKLKQFRSDPYSGSFYNLQAGCWNFYIMNDLKPYLDLRLLHELVNSKSYDCYTVGFMQPYMMNHELPCKSITMVDIDNRIHAAHYEIYQLAKQGKFENRSRTVQAIRELNLGWIAFSGGRLLKRHPVTPSTLCRIDQNYCINTLVEFANSINGNREPASERVDKESKNNRNRLHSLTHQISPLHMAEFEAKENQTPVIYLSNAVEEYYTTQDQFNKLLQNVRSQWNQAYMIYHAAGTHSMGLYEIRKDSVSTICKDTYLRIAGDTLKPYTTFFEKITETKSPNSCASMIQNRKILLAPLPE